jgi:hypothetical protein
MRVLALLGLAALLLVPGVQALVVADPMPIFVTPGGGSPLCPAFGMTTGYCVRVKPSAQGTGAHASAGDARGPHAGLDGSVAIGDLDGDGAPDLAWSAQGGASPCPQLMVMMVLPVSPPFWPCEQGLDLEGSAGL